jgi:hypothetical protein
MHYTVQSRGRFADWVEEGFPSVAVIDVNHEERQIDADLMLRRMRRCTDVLPSALGETIGVRLGLESSLRGRTYGEAARRLLAAGATETP